MEEEFNQLEVLKAKIESANKEIELLKQLQNEQIINVKPTESDSGETSKE